MKWIAAYLVVFAVTLGLLVTFENFEAAEPLFILVIAGGGFSALGWLVTRKATPLEGVSMHAPWWGLLAYLVFLGVILAFGFPKNPWLQIAVKLLIFVVVPIVAFRIRLPLRFSRSDAMITILMFVILMTFQILVGSGVKKIAAAGIHGPALATAVFASFVWMTIEAGVTEEVAFRALLQTRLEELTRSRAGGIAVASVVFALVHAPGLYLRTAGTGESFQNPSVLHAVGYAIVVISPIALFFGFLWTRTRNILVLALLHGTVDTLPHVVEVARTLGLKT